ncbi:pyridoxal phosphate-dependent transferase [Kockovaella imperatae]|uniref:Pyridoxal phosphate-dependent transferase n=1 Tax=Kockovaella imperatae TaxID=4999 RepID=A0A1Y1UQC4_9TREE|nr:pyridoxal phosphate-dependent transferase [Kockovaella imperatae]ORX39656.1 pyridoxal phosphate-dependent transferase [Kockovaella imperatae]
MPLLYPNLRISQVFGANTDVGKTLLTTALVRSTALRYKRQGLDGQKVLYLKPVSTGPDSESDVSYVLRNAGDHRKMIKAENLYQYREPMSPHLAARLARDLPFPKENDILVRAVTSSIQSFKSQIGSSKGSVFVETAGGVHSPALHPPHTQSTFLRPLRLPSILIASPHLGGISTTLTSYESLLVRGYSISAVLCLQDRENYYRNHEFLSEYFGERGIKCWSVPPPPEKRGTLQEDTTRLGEWYESLETDHESGVSACVDWLEKEHGDRIEELDGMAERTLNTVWYPFTQHGIVNKKEDIMIVDSAHDDFFDAYYSKPKGESSRPTSADQSLLRPYFDGSASWFTQSHGHASEPLTLAAASAAGRYGHVLFPSGSNKPALELAEKLLETVGQGWAERVFYSDDGSTGVEVALKMALRAAGRRYGWDGVDGEEVGVIGLRGGYHGDTIGSMDATPASTYNTAVDWYKGRGHWFSPTIVTYVNGRPTVYTTSPDTWAPLDSSDAALDASSDGSGWSIGFDKLDNIYDLSTRLSTPMADYYRRHIRLTFEDLVLKQGKRFGAMMIEPTCLGAGGMVFVDPLFQACLVEVVRSSSDLFGGSGSYKDDLSGLGKRDTSEWQGLPVIYDEVFSGLHRFGYHSAASVLHHTPDISIYAKILTGGLLPLAATLASSSIFKAFLSPHKVDALLHGHSYTANPVGCAVALKSMEMMTGQTWEAERALWNGSQRWSFWSEAFIKNVSQADGVKGAMAMGTVFAMELEDAEGGYSSHRAQNFLTELRQVQIGSEDEVTPFQIHSRPLGNVVYIMTSLFSKPEVIRTMEGEIIKKLWET